ncbi:MAG: zeta toxin family protein [Alphaproteobacteria bacterium]|nr:zeta toxin family protein [Alphaproteobacteria bacterium]MBN2780270.1 zeta toxin family protein [Alphaproteobacteria bacterium]
MRSVLLYFKRLFGRILGIFPLKKVGQKDKEKPVLRRKRHCLIIAGPNGAGKSTCADAIVPQEMRITEFVNADKIAAGLSPYNPEAARFTAGKLLINRIEQLITARENFALETTLAPLGLIHLIKRMQKEGYIVTLSFLWLSSQRLAKERVKTRVESGGHDIPQREIYRRYKRGLINLFKIYLPFVDFCAIYNASTFPPEIVARYAEGALVEMLDASLFNAIKGSIDDKGPDPII